MSGIWVPHIAESVSITGEEHRHLVRSLRARVGDTVWLTDGRGTLAQGEIQAIKPDSVEVRVTRTLNRPGEPPAPIDLLVSPLKQPQRTEWLVEKAVELGATAVYLLPMNRTVRSSVNMARLERVGRAALKQNLRSVLPLIRLVQRWEEVLWDSYTYRLMGEIGAKLSLKERLPERPAPTLWIVGPEGDFTDEEKAYLKTRGVEGVSLGSLRLRAETAATLFLSALKVQWRF
ncbi:MAG: 16S rRNA (uracil(1498)-N(3))-methyltransferase [Bacteroidia bacterium]|nr:16S rRNA (uracil(1498)-N(3))-methyltransferase [Bacteroidia bacterium]